MYPNAANGVKKIFIAEILALVAVILGAAANIADVFLSKAAGEDEGTSAVVTILGLSMGVIALVSFFLNMAGVNEASRDETAFKNAFAAIIAGIAFTLANGFFNVSNNIFIESIFEITIDIASLTATLFIIIGIRNLAGSLKDEKMEKKGGTLLNIVFIFSALVILDKAVLLIYQNQADTTVVAVAGLFAIVAVILAVIKYFLYLSYLAKANKMLAE